MFTPEQMQSMKFEQKLNRFVQDLVKDAVIEEIEAAKKRLEERIPELISKIAVTIQISADQMQNDAIIQIRMHPRLD